MAEILEKINAVVWGLPALVGILGVGLYLTLGTGFVQLRLFPDALRRFLGMFRGKDKSSFRSLCTALGATVGTGNLVGVAGAICLGGPGSIFWMWVCGFLGMATKYAEAVLAVRFREREAGEYRGGPMYIIIRGLGEKWRWLAATYCFFGLFAAFGVGNATQINAMLTALRPVTGERGNLILGMGIAALVGVMLSGGAKRIGSAAERLVPLAAGGYILLCVLALILRYDRIGDAFVMIFRGAFSPKAVTGGALGSVFCVLRVGCARGVFTNEAGMGTASIAHASAEVRHPVQQGMMGIMEVFLDTIVICTLTALVILTSGTEIPYGFDAGGDLVARAFSLVCGDWTGIFLALSLCCFAFATILGWGLYGLRCANWLLGHEAEKWFVVLQMGAAVLGAMLETGVIWLLAETVNGLMAIPNLLALAFLSGEIRTITGSWRGNGRRNHECSLT
ncbi:MAG: sodium:alanine symporter family protein [Oscillospiraceae bacterium]|nr:sodium:alanine symporter family protein [Oscillospiraceae bacterium]MBR6595143.1 sodium:alanine symporter family protein [Oscillospiraceae bacterium]